MFAISSAMKRKSSVLSSRLRMRTKIAMFFRSASTRRSMSGYCTFDGDDAAVVNTALCTCASDAAAIGCGSKVATRLSSGLPSSRSTTRG